MTLDSALETINEVLSNVTYSNAFLQEIQTARTKLTESVSGAYTTLDYLGSTRDGDNEAKYAINSLETSSSEYLQEAILEALSSTAGEEFNYSIFSEALLEVAKKPGLIDIMKVGAGYSSRISVNIDLASHAGTLADWARGVAYHRDKINLQPGDAQKASDHWREKFYRQGPYDKIIKDRIAGSNQPAAFWMLLDKGTTKLASDIGGTAYPSGGPTHFIDKAVDRIEKRFIEMMDNQWRQTRDFQDRISAAIREANARIEDIDRIVTEISTELEKNKALYQEFAHVKAYADQDKLDDLIVRVRRDLEISGATSAGRKEATLPGSTKRYRPYISRIEKIVKRY